MNITSEMIFIVFSAIFFKPFLRYKIDPMPLKDRQHTPGSRPLLVDYKSPGVSTTQ
jgi:hypothetical protein